MYKRLVLLISFALIVPTASSAFLGEAGVRGATIDLSEILGEFIFGFPPPPPPPEEEGEGGSPQGPSEPGSEVPEPTPALLTALGLVGLAIGRRRGA